MTPAHTKSMGGDEGSEGEKSRKESKDGPSDDPTQQKRRKVRQRECRENGKIRKTDLAEEEGAGHQSMGEAFPSFLVSALLSSQKRSKLK